MYAPDNATSQPNSCRADDAVVFGVITNRHQRLAMCADARILFYGGKSMRAYI